MLKVFAEKLRDAINLGIGPEVGIKPGKLVGGCATKGGPQDPVIGVEHWELSQQSLGFPSSLFGSHEGRAILDRTGDHRKELDDRLMGNSGALFGDALAQDCVCGPLLPEIARIEAV